MFRVGAGAAPHGRRWAGRRQRAARTGRVSKPHRTARRGNPRHSAAYAVGPYRAHVRQRHGRHSVRVCVHRRGLGRRGHGRRGGKAQPTQHGRGHLEYGRRGGPRLGSLLRTDRAAQLRAGRPVAHGYVRHHGSTACRGRRQEPYAFAREPARPFSTGRHAGRGGLFAHDRRAAAAVHVLAHHRRRGRGRPGRRRSRPRPDRRTGVHHRHRTGGARVFHRRVGSRLCQLASVARGRHHGVSHGRHSGRGRGFCRSPRLFRDRGSHRL